MKLTNIKEINAFKEAIAKCRGDVWLLSPYGDKYQLKSLFNQYLALLTLQQRDNQFAAKQQT